MNFNSPHSTANLFKFNIIQNEGLWEELYKYTNTCLPLSFDTNSDVFLYSLLEYKCLKSISHCTFQMICIYNNFFLNVILNCKMYP